MFKEPSLVTAESLTLSRYPTLSASQGHAVELLQKFYSLRGVELIEGFKPRIDSLLVGPSGSGKTAAVNAFAESADLPIMSICAGSWIVLGSSQASTLLSIGKFVSENSSGIIFIDELDKICPIKDALLSHTWSLSVVSEVLSFLDSDDRLLRFGWTRNDLQKFRLSFLVIGAGAWQHHVSGDLKEYIAAIQKESGIPPEICLRFRQPYILIIPPTPGDFTALIVKIRRELGLPHLKKSELDKEVDRAIVSGLGMRWAETYLVSLLVTHPELIAERRAALPSQPYSKTSLSCSQRKKIAEEFTDLVRQMPELIISLHNTLLITQPEIKNHQWIRLICGDNTHSSSLLFCFQSIIPSFSFEMYSDQQQRDAVGKPLIQRLSNCRTFMEQALRSHLDILIEHRMLAQFASVFSKLTEIARCMDLLSDGTS